MTRTIMIGVDLAKNVIQVHAARMTGEVEYRKQLSREKFRRFMAEQPPAVVVMEACGSAHYWARELGRVGHAVNPAMSEATDRDKPQRIAFRASSRRESLPREKAKRQGDVTSLAFLRLGGRDGAMAFLNNIDAELGGRPLDIAIASEEGCERVRQMILKRGSAVAGRK